LNQLNIGVNSSILREYDIRGIVGDTFLLRDGYNIGRAFGSMLLECGGKSVSVGYDGRLSSPEIENQIVKGLSSTGLKVFRIGLGPSPMLYFSMYSLKVDAGVMITGSHNPPEYNGIKMNMFGKAFFGDDIKELGIRCRTQNFIEGHGEVSSRVICNQYVSRLLSDYKGERSLRVAWDPGNGASCDILAKMVKGLPGDHFLINEIIDGTFPAHHPDPTIEKNLEQLKEVVEANNCELGIAFDGDGDRIGVIDSHGRILWGDQLLVILAREVLLEEPGATIIADIKASMVFQEEIERLGGTPFLWKSGHSHIKTKMIELVSPLAGEMSAHIFFKHRYYGYDDALYTAIRLLSILASGEKTLSKIYDELPKFVNTPEIRIDCPDDQKFVIVDKVHKRLRENGSFELNDIDGVRVSTEDGWWLLRASNTQPALVARCESRTAEGLSRLKGNLISLLSEFGVMLKSV